MKQTLTWVVLIGVLCGIILFVLYSVQKTKQNDSGSTPRVETNATSSASITASTTQDTVKLNPVVYPLYSGVSWQQASRTVENGVPVAKVQSIPLTNITDLAAVFQPFTTYYHDVLTKDGWVQDMAQEAGGPGSETSTYKKGDDFVTVSYRSIFHVKNDDVPEQCPCDLQLELTSNE